MLENGIKYENVSSEDETQVHYIENSPHLQYMSLNKDNFEVANEYNLKLRKKKRIRTAFTTDQVLLLENTFSERKYIDKWTRKKIANRLKISEKNVKVWFQNRRMKNKRLSSESSDSGEANDGQCKNNKSNENNTSWEMPSSTSDSYNQNMQPSCNVFEKNNGVESYTPQFVYGASNKDFYYTELCQQQQYDSASSVPNFAFNNNPHYYDFNNYYYYNPTDYDYSAYSYNWPQQFTN